MYKVIIDSSSGFCAGVIRAIHSAEDYLGSHSKLHALGELVHNSIEMDRLRALGLETVDLEGAKKADCVLIRAHGEPPSTYQALEGKDIIDCTCPVVLKNEKDICKAYEKGSGIVIFGKKGHPEVIALAGQTLESAVIIENPTEPLSWNGVVPEEKIIRLFDSPVIEVFSQTTKDPEDYAKLGNILRFIFEDRKVIIHNTICKTVSSRFEHLTAFATSNDCILFVAGKDSSNGKVLFNHCKAANPNTIFISSPEDVTEGIIPKGVLTVGICGATSTPKWLLEDVAEKVSSIQK
ncbi:MAG: 4-hydroxy-3-methylbut-2-enyl diphosphate reductase [Bacteroidales bacterium]|nr:4-hydroxy-3-methylbut-2-enyl diphosphate reductase [Bacteroidales bacterium]